MKLEVTITRKIAPDVKLARDVKIHDFVKLYGCGIGDDTKIGTFIETLMAVLTSIQIFSHGTIL